MITCWPTKLFKTSKISMSMFCLNSNTFNGLGNADVNFCGSEQYDANAPFWTMERQLNIVSFESKKVQ